MNSNSIDRSPTYSSWRQDFASKNDKASKTVSHQLNFFVDDQVIVKKVLLQKQVRVHKLQERVQSMERRLNNLNNISPIGKDQDNQSLKSASYMTQIEKNQDNFVKRQSSPYIQQPIYQDFNQKILEKEYQAEEKRSQYYDAKKESKRLRQELCSLQEEYNKMSSGLNLTKDAKKESKKLEQELGLLQIEYNKMSTRILEINKNFDQLVQNNKDLQQERDHIKRNFQLLQIEKNELSSRYEKQLEQIDLIHHDQSLDFVKSIDSKNKSINELQSMIQKECEKLSNELKILRINDATKLQIDNQQINQKKLNNEIKNLTECNLEQSKLIQLTLQEAFYLGQVAIFASDILLRHNSEELPTTLVMLQKDLASKKTIILNKIEALKNISECQFNFQGVDNKQIAVSYDNYQSPRDINLLENILSNRSQQENYQQQTNQFDHMLRLQQENQSLKLKNSQNIKIEQNQFFENDDAICLLIIQCNTIERLIQG